MYFSYKTGYRNGYYDGRLSGMVSVKIGDILFVHSKLFNPAYNVKNTIDEGQKYRFFTNEFLKFSILIIQKHGGIDKAIDIANDGNDKKEEDVIKKIYCNMVEFSTDMSEFEK